MPIKMKIKKPIGFLFEKPRGKKSADTAPSNAPSTVVSTLPSNLASQPSTADFPILISPIRNLPDLRLNPRAVARQMRHEYRAPEDITASVPVGIKVAAMGWDDQLKVYHQNAQRIMMVALEKKISYYDLVKMYKEDFTNDEIIEEAKLIFKNWDNLKNVMLLYVKLDPEMANLEILIDAMATAPEFNRKGTFKLICNEQRYPSAITGVQRDILDDELFRLAFGSRDGIVHLYLLRHLAKKYKLVLANPPNHAKVRQLISTLEFMSADPDTQANEVAAQVEMLEVEMENLPVPERAQYKRPREYLHVPVNSRFDRRQVLEFEAWAKRSESIPLVAMYARNSEKADMRRKILNGEIKLPPVGQFDHEDTARETPDLALARLNGHL